MHLTRKGDLHPLLPPSNSWPKLGYFQGFPGKSHVTYIIITQNKLLFLENNLIENHFVLAKVKKILSMGAINIIYFLVAVELNFMLLNSIR